MQVLTLDAISKSYGPVRALKGVTFSVPQGSVFGILGPNGSGKTTLLGIVLDVLLADAGSYSWLGGTEPATARRQIGALLETPNFYHYLSAWDNLEITAAIKGHSRDDRERVLRMVRLWERRNSKFSTFSLGMKQRLAIAAALLGSPSVLVLDEPTNGLDPVGIAEIRGLIRDLAAQGMTIIMASHLLDEVEKVCTHVAVLKLGSLLTTGPVAEAMNSRGAGAAENSSIEVEIRAADMTQLQAIAVNIPGVRSVKQTEGMLVVECEAGMPPEELNRSCMDRGVALQHLRLRNRSLEEKFMELTGGQSAAST